MNDDLSTEKENEKDSEKTTLQTNDLDKISKKAKKENEEVTKLKENIDKKVKFKSFLTKIFKNKLVISLIILIIILLLTIMFENNKYKKLITEYDTNISNLKRENENLERQKSAVKDNFSAYQAKMKPYEELQEKEAKEKLEKIKQEEEKKKQEEKEKKEAEEKAKEEEKKKGYDTGITFENLARNPKNYMYKKVKFKAKVIQVIRGQVEQYRVAIDNDYKKVILVEYINKTGSNILENDKILLMGVSDGEITYESTLHAKITIPKVLADSIEVIN